MYNTEVCLVLQDILTPKECIKSVCLFDTGPHVAQAMNSLFLILLFPAPQYLGLHISTVNLDSKRVLKMFVQKSK